MKNKLTTEGVVKVEMSQILEDAKVKMLLEAPPTDSLVGARDRAVMEMLHSTGVKAGELAALDLVDVDFLSEVVHVWGKGKKGRRIVPISTSIILQGNVYPSRDMCRCISFLKCTSIILHGNVYPSLQKGRRHRIVSISASALQAIQHYMEMRDRKAQSRRVSPHPPNSASGSVDNGKAQSRTEADANALFVGRGGRRLTSKSVNDIVKRWARIAGLGRHVSSGTLRNSFAVRMLRNGADIKTVQELLGHESVITTYRVGDNDIYLQTNG